MEKPSYGLSGLENQGATCYLNSLLQALFMTPEFRFGILSLTEDELVLNNTQNITRRRHILIELQKLFLKLNIRTIESFSTKPLTDSFGWNNKETLDQHDIQELSQLLFDALEQSLSGTKQMRLLCDVFSGNLLNQTICNQCHHISECEEKFNALTVFVENHQSLEESLVTSYLSESEISCGEEAEDKVYLCSKCNEKVSAKRRCRIERLPPVLICNLRRFRYNIQLNRREKVNSKFTFPLSLNFGAFLYHKNESLSDISNEDVFYDLCVAIIHRGQANVGHYHAFIKDILNEGKWDMDSAVNMSMDEMNNGIKKTNSTSKNKFIAKEATETIEKILNGASDKKLSIKEVKNAFLKLIGKNWKSVYSKSLGPIKQFLKNTSNFFRIENENVEIIPLTERKTQNWFHFNDEFVFPISESKLETIFGGKGTKESAYVLFYRLRDSKNGQNLEKYKNFQISEKLKENILKEIEIESQEKIEEDKKRNKIEITFVKLTENEEKEEIKTVLNKNQSIFELFESICEKTGISIENLCVSFIFNKKLKRLTMKKSQKIREINFSEENVLFVEEKKNNNNKKLLATIEFERIRSVVTLKVEDHSEKNPFSVVYNSNPKFETFTFHLNPKEITFNELKKKVLEKFDKPKALLLRTKANGGCFRNTKGKLFLEEHISIYKKISQNNNKSNNATSENAIIIQFDGFSLPKQSETHICFKVVPIEMNAKDILDYFDIIVPKTIILSDLKIKMAKIAHLNPENVRLRKSNRNGSTGNVLSDENQSLDSLKQITNSFLILEPLMNMKKSFLSFEVYMNSNKYTKEMLKSDIIDESEKMNGVKETPNSIKNPFEWRNPPLIRLKTVEIDKNANINDLKISIQKTYLNQKFDLNSYFIRISEYQNNIIGRIFRENLDKLSDILNRKLFIEIVKDEETEKDLTKNDILLYLCKRDAVSCSYNETPVEIIFKKYWGYNKLLKIASERLEIPEKCLVLALKRGFSYLKLSAPKRGGKGKKARKVFDWFRDLKDRDIITCCDHEKYPNDDFMTSYDRFIMSQQKREAELSGKSCSKKGSEAVLRIKVDSF